jgi:hypothetical protein
MYGKMTTSRMGIMGSLRVSNFSLPWVTDSPLGQSLLQEVPAASGLCNLKNITDKRIAQKPEVMPCISQLALPNQALLRTGDKWGSALVNLRHIGPCPEGDRREPSSRVRAKRPAPADWVCTRIQPCSVHVFCFVASGAFQSGRSLLPGPRVERYGQGF